MWFLITIFGPAIAGFSGQLRPGRITLGGVFGGVDWKAQDLGGGGKAHAREYSHHQNPVFTISFLLHTPFSGGLRSMCAKTLHNSRSMVKNLLELGVRACNRYTVVGANAHWLGLTPRASSTSRYCMT